jgi:hypothetical protein
MAACILGSAAAWAAAGPPASDPLAETWRLLATPVSLDGSAKTLDRLLEDLKRQVPGLQVSIGPEIAESGRHLSLWKVALVARGIPASEVLDLAASADLVWEVQPGGVRIGLRERYVENLSTVRYPVARLLAPRPGKWQWGPPPQDGWQSYLALVLRFVNHMGHPRIAAWADNGGPADAMLAGTDLVVRQTPEGQQAVARLLSVLSAGLGVPYEGPAPASPPAPPREDRQAMDEVRRLLRQPVDLDLEHTSLPNFLAYIAEVVPGLKFVVDPDVADADIDLSTRIVCAKAKGVPVEAALRVCLGSHLAYLVRPGYVVVTTRDRLDRGLPAAVYPIRDLYARQAWSWDGEYDWQQSIIALLERTVNCWSDRQMAAWSDAGGPAVIEFWQGMLVITQTERGQERVREFLKQFRTAVALARAIPSRPRGPVPFVVAAEPPELAATADALRTRIDVDFRDTPLLRAIENIAGRDPPLSVLLDIPVWQEKVTLKRQAVTREALFQELLQRKHCCAVHPGYVILTGGDDAPAGLPVAMYPVRDLVRGSRAQDLPSIIQTTINHKQDGQVETWTDEGGAAALLYFSDILIVSQSRHAQRRINALLQDLRFSQRGGTGVP